MRPNLKTALTNALPSLRGDFRKWAVDHLAGKHDLPEPEQAKPIELVPVSKGWECENKHRFDYPKRGGVGLCPVCGTIKIHLLPEPGATEPDDPKPLPTRDLSDIPAPPKADAAFFERENRELQSQGE